MSKPMQNKQRLQNKSKHIVGNFSAAMETIAPTGLAQSWDNVGLLAGDPKAALRRVLLCIDLTAEVAKEAASRRIDLVLAYHPPIFKPIAAIRADSAGTDAAVFQCISNGTAIYTTHTALDAAEGGTNDVIAELCGATSTEPIEYVDRPSAGECKLVVFVPREHLDTVSDAMFRAGAGHIGDYSHCSYRTAGQGTFFGGEGTSPAVGKSSRREVVDEIRLETVTPAMALPAVVQAMLAAHPYEEPAFDIIPLRPPPVRGIGRIGELTRPCTLAALARKLKKATGANCVQRIGSADRIVRRAIVLVGAAGSLPLGVPPGESDVIVSGEIRHHDALSIQRLGATAIALGHWSSERPVLQPLATRLASMLPKCTTLISEADRDPFES